MRFALFALTGLAVVACSDQTTGTADTHTHSLTTATGTGTGTGTGATATGTGTGATGTGTGSTTSIEILGVYTDDFYATHTIDDTMWSIGYPGYDPSVINLTQFDNAADWAVGQNDSANNYYPDDWSRFDWYVDPITSELYVCQTGYAEANEADALALAPADSANLATGCGGFPWSVLTP